jgi:hypothetical protein
MMPIRGFEVVTKSTKKRQENPTLPLAREVAAERLRRSGFVTLRSLKRHGEPAEPVEQRFPRELVRKLAGG